MNKRFLTLFVLVAALSVASVALAQSTPAEDPKDNACYAGGAWEGKCDWPTEAEDEWAWNCGWYYARVIDGRIGAAQYPADCGQQVSITCYFDGLFADLCLSSDGSYTFSLGDVTYFTVGEIDTYSDVDGFEQCTADILTITGFESVDEMLANNLFIDILPVSLFLELADQYPDRLMCMYFELSISNL
jgi:hypothetical protein